MTREAKVGLMMVAVLVGVFGFLLYKRMHRPAEALAEQAAVENTGQQVAEDFGARLRLDDEPRPAKKRERSRLERDVEAATDRVERVADDVVDGVELFAGKKKKAKKPAPPKELPEDDFTFDSQPEPKPEPRSEPVRLKPPATEEGFSDFAEPRTRTGRNIRQVSGTEEDAEPFEEEVSVAKPRSRDNRNAESFERSEPSREEQADFGSEDRTTKWNHREERAQPAFREPQRPEDPRIAPAGFADDNAEPARRPREFDNSFNDTPRERRHAAPVAITDDEPSMESLSRRNQTISGATYTVQPNDNFWTISRSRYGAGRYYKALALHNQDLISDPRMMKPGVTINTPDAVELERRYGDVIPKPAPADAVQFASSTQSRNSEAEPAGYFVSPQGAPMYRIGENDTLTGIAKSHLGRTSRWVQILEMNRNVLRDGNELRIGTVLRLPADASRVQVVGSLREYR